VLLDEEIIRTAPKEPEPREAGTGEKLIAVKKEPDAGLEHGICAARSAIR
jgi:hypothetical protein